MDLDFSKHELTNKLDINRYVKIRQHLHKYPELGFEEHNTAELVARELSDLGLHPVRGIGRTGIVAVVEGLAGSNGRSVGLRADMDALPIEEVNTFEHASKVPGKMHGCGHDGHTVMLLAAAKLLTENRRNFSGRVILIFQPGEEGHAGAREMLDDGLLDRFDIDEIYGLHNWPSLPAGEVGLNERKMMAGIDRFSVDILGRGGHGGHQYQTNDPLMPMARIILDLQTIVSKNINALREAVVSLNLATGGTTGALSVVPNGARLEGMTKWYDKDIRDLLEERISQIVEGAATAFRIQTKINYERLYPPTLNDPECAERLFDTAVSLIGADSCHWNVDPSMGSEDFAFFLEQRPGAFFRLGQGGVERPLHNPNYDFNDEIISLGAAMHASIAFSSLGTVGTR